MFNRWPSEITKARRRLVIMVILAMAAMLPAIGCATSAKPSAMQPNLQVTPSYKASVSSRVIGDCPGITDADFREALDATIKSSNLFAEVTASDRADFLLEVAIIGFGGPAPGLNMHSSMTTRWRLRRRGSEEILFETIVHEEFTATVGQAFAGLTRMRKANEGVVRETIREGVERLSNANVPGTI